ncbi:hypothetical protein P7K49_021114, partial [Saguinus oedipus]
MLPTCKDMPATSSSSPRGTCHFLLSPYHSPTSPAGKRPGLTSPWETVPLPITARKKIALGSTQLPVGVAGNSTISPDGHFQMHLEIL